MCSVGPLYIDVSEIRSLSRHGDEVTGVSRVVLEIAHELCTRRVAIPVYCDTARCRMMAVDPEVFADEMIYDRLQVADRIGHPGRYRDPLRYRGSSLRRYHALLLNSLRARFGSRAEKPGNAVIGAADVSRCAILCLGSLPSSFRTLDVIRRSGGQAKAALMIHDVMRIAMNRHDPDSVVRRVETTAIERCNAMGVTWMANSHHTRQDALRLVADGLLPPLTGGIEVVPLAHEMRDAGGMGSADAVPVTSPYLLTVGGLDGRKNGQLLCEALLSLYERDGPGGMIRVVCAGRNPVTGIRAAFGEGGRYAVLAPFFHWLESPDHATLRGLYAAATALVFPSRYEGFGLPVGEALWQATPVIASDATSLPEVGGDLARYVDPDDSGALAALVHEVMTDQDAMARWRERIIAARPMMRRWQDVALHMRRILER